MKPPRLHTVANFQILIRMRCYRFVPFESIDCCEQLTALQVWFSGRHSDIGGGLDDPRLSDIALGWMIAQVAKDRKLAFIDIDEDHGHYLVTPEALQKPTEKKWSTCKGSANEPEW